MNQDLMRLVRRYADGGAVEEMPNPAGLPSIDIPQMLGMGAGPMQAQPGPAMPPQGMPGMPQGAPAAPPDSLASLYAKWQPRQGAYDQELRAAQARERAEQAAFNQLIEQSTQQKTQGPSQAEMYFRLASAFGAPTRTGSFSESLGNASGVLADMEKLKREAASSDKKTALEAQFKLRGLGLQSAKDETSTLRQLAGQESQFERQLGMQDAQAKRQEALARLKAELEKDKEKILSEGGKIAKDAGLTPGTPEFNQFVMKHAADKLEGSNVFKQMAAGNASMMTAIAGQNAETSRMRADIDRQRLEDQREKGKKLTPKELDLKIEAEDQLKALGAVEKLIDEAEKLNPKAFTATWGDKAQRAYMEGTQGGHEKVRASRNLDNILTTKAADGLKAAFGGNPTEGERAIQLMMQGMEAKSTEERADILKRSKEKTKTQRESLEKRLKLINAGQYRDTSSSATAAPTE